MTVPAVVTGYQINQLCRITATFLSTDGSTLADPSTVIFAHKDASGIVATYVYTGGAGGGSITRAGVGAYYKDLVVDVQGNHFYRVEGTGGVIAAEEFTFKVEPSQFVL